MIRLLLLAGTAEARALAARLAARADVSCVASLAGVTERPERYEGRVRIGGFGGAEGLADWLRAERIDVVIDATHPFATRISANALAAARQTGAAHARLERPAWAPEPDDRWLEAADAEAAAAAQPSGARVFLALGRSGLVAFRARRDLWLAARMIEPPAAETGLDAVILARPPYRLEDEIALLRRLAISHLAARNAGGAGGRAKLLAARALGLPVTLIARPVADPPPARRLDDVDAALAWLETEISGRGGE